MLAITLLDRNYARRFRFVAIALLGVVPTLTAAGASLSTNFSQKQAYWMDRSRVVIPAADYTSGNTYSIVTSPTGGIVLNSAKTGLTGGTESIIPLTLGGTLTAAELTKYPQLSTYAVFTVSSSVPLASLESALTGQMVFSSVNTAGTLTYATGLQYGAVLDDLYYYPGCLGVVMNATTTCNDATNPNDASLQIRVWAPTAKSVSLLLYNAETDTTPETTIAMREVNGVWSADGTWAWVGKYYMYNVNVFVPSSGVIVANVTTDPYSIDLAPNGSLSRITDLDDEANKPAGWDTSSSPALNTMNDLSIYELHVRDFSIGDPTVPAPHQGTYDAFGDANSNGMQHLAALAKSGLKAVHILPTFHFSSINEVVANWKATADLSGDPPSSQAQQAAVTAVQGSDAYNWGYDPVHFMAPEGGYAMNPDNRVYEYRVMVMGLHNAGLRVIQDQVFNHTAASGQGTSSNLDEVVPNYYHRFNATGTLDTASCCADTASEHLMMEKLMIDTVVQNAKEYKIDGYRFDLMCLHFTYNVQHMYQALQQFTMQNSGINGATIYLYGEGWNFGETANNAIGPAATQLGMQGFGGGTFNDRIRDAVRGDDGADQTQGFSTGLATDSSAFTSANTTQAAQNTALLQADDSIRIGLTGNLANYTFTNYLGNATTGAAVPYGSSPTGYTSVPIEAIQYASVHDNQLLFDAVQEKASLNDSSATRARRQVLAMSVIGLSQGIPFFAGGDDMLRSKDMDQNSYNSGDWFNKIDWSGQGDNWGIGLPISSQNSGQWTFETPLLSNGMYTPQPADIAYATAAFQELMQIRYSSTLFRMSTLAQIQRQLLFLNTGPSQTPGLIVMELKTPPSVPGGQIVVVFNATMQQQTYTSAALAGLRLELHPVQQNSADPITRTASFNPSSGTVTVPALTTSVFISH